jgi:hypothetical protein
MPWSPSFRTIAGEFGSPRSRGCLLREWPVYSRKRRARRTVCIPSPGTARGISGSATRIRVFFICGGSVVERIPWARLGRKDFASALLPDPLQGGLWLGFYQGGVAYFKDGQVRASYASADGLGEGRVTAFNSIGTVRSGPQPRAG